MKPADLELAAARADEKREQVREYYGRVLSGTRDLRTSACCPTDAFPPEQKSILALIDDEILDRFYGCGSPIPPLLDDATVLDLGCGTGRDAYIASKLVGPNGSVIGVDMTEEQVDVARRHLDAQTLRFGYEKANTTFHHGFIEDLSEIGIADASIDVVISNCVINLSPDKGRVFSEVFRVLKPGGEFYFSDVFAGRRVPEELRHDPVLYGECLAGALYIEDFRRLLREAGISDYRVVAKRRLDIDDPEVEASVGMVDFYAMTVRAFKLDSLEDICEDYGQIATYKGTVPLHPHRFVLDDHHVFETGKPERVCGNTAAMLAHTRFRRHFDVAGDLSTHYGPFACASPAGTDGSDVGGACC